MINHFKTSIEMLIVIIAFLSLLNFMIIGLKPILKEYIYPSINTNIKAKKDYIYSEDKLKILKSIDKINK